MGNRGGRFHDPETLSVRGRPFAGRRWITCVLEFKGRRRAVWGRGYTELFFLDEAVALAAGHRPCFECRRAQAEAFAAAFARALGGAAPRADTMDVQLHAERRTPASSLLSATELEALPDGAMVATPRGHYALRAGAALLWSPARYQGIERRSVLGPARLLTPPSVVAALAAGYAPLWHDSADSLAASAARL